MHGLLFPMAHCPKRQEHVHPARPQAAKGAASPEWFRIGRICRGISMSRRLIFSLSIFALLQHIHRSPANNGGEAWEEEEATMQRG